MSSRTGPLLARTSVHAGVHVEGRPGRERLDSGAVPGLHLHRQELPEPGLLERRRRQPSVVAAHDRPALAPDRRLLDDAGAQRLPR